MPLLRRSEEKVREVLKSESCHPIFLSQQDIENFYYGFCNKTIWPLFHYFIQYTVFSKNFWNAYRQVNRVFCDAVVKIAEPEDTIWIHDYHLMLLPELVRERLPDARIGFFLHIPFPSFEVFSLLPWREEIVEGLLGADLIGFHTYDCVKHFLDSVRRLLGYEHTLGQITTSNRVVKVDAFPMGIDYERFATVVTTPEVQKEIKKIRRKSGNRKVILSIDRMDYTKGIPQRLEAFDLFLETYPEYRERVLLVLIAVPSRTGIEHYRLLKKQVDELVGEINGKHGTIDWMPVWYLYRYIPFRTLVALYNVADVALITPLRDGMNLMAKEFIATKTDGRGVLILSEMAGAAKELGEAIVVNPNNEEKIVEALREALTMPEEEQIARNRAMQRRLGRYNVVRWANDFMERLSYIKRVQHELIAKRITPETKKKLIKSYIESESRLLLLDYDGTLVPLVEKPEEAIPDDELMKVLEALARNAGDEVVIISGRDKRTLEKWFGSLNVGLIAEHGAWIKEKGGNWETIEPLRNDWKEEILPILELYVDRTPGSFIEEKEFSLVWHYRRVDPELASVRARELKETLLQLTANLNLGVLEGSKVIEIKNVGVNKGRAALRWISKKKWGFILAVGDDWTDEDVFAALPDRAFSIKVGLTPSKAEFNLTSHYEVRDLLKDLASNVLKVASG